MWQQNAYAKNVARDIKCSVKISNFGRVSSESHCRSNRMYPCFYLLYMLNCIFMLCSNGITRITVKKGKAWYINWVCGLHKCTCFGSTYTKIGTIQRRLAWPLRKDDTQIREAFHIFHLSQYTIFLSVGKAALLLFIFYYSIYLSVYLLDLNIFIR
jgi:hypothetical protein